MIDISGDWFKWLKEKISEGQISVSSSSSRNTVSTSSGNEDSGKTTTALPSSIKNLPQMVGGC